MAVMKTCCCCGVRSGSVASAIYSVVIAILGIGNFGLSLLWSDSYKAALYELQEQSGVFGDLNIDAYVCAQNAEYIFAVVFLGLVFVTSIIAMVGICQDSKGMLVPFMAAKSLGFVWYVFATGLAAYAMANIGIEAVGVGLISLMVMLIPFLIADIVCLLCVLSQYQEYRDGRGRLTDQRGTTVVITQQSYPAGSGSFAYRQMQQDPPPAYGSPVPTKPDVI